MEDVLEVYHRPYDPTRPQVCLDETSRQLLGHVYEPLPARPGRLTRVDDEYTRGGTVNVFCAVEPRTGRCLAEATSRRTSVDFAHFVRRLVDEIYPRAERLVLVMDNLSSHSPSALYEAFPPAEARRLVEKLELHFTPKHGSWLNIAEIELSILSRQCLDQRFADATSLRAELAAWQARRNHEPRPIQWRFTTADARTKLRRLYPSL